MDIVSSARREAACTLEVRRKPGQRKHFGGQDEDVLVLALPICLSHHVQQVWQGHREWPKTHDVRPDTTPVALMVVGSPATVRVSAAAQCDCWPGPRFVFGSDVGCTMRVGQRCFLRRLWCFCLDRVFGPMCGEIRRGRLDEGGRATRRRHHEARTELLDSPLASSVVSGLSECSWAWDV